MVAAGRGELNAGSISPAFLSGDSNGAGYLRQLAVLIVPASTGILGSDSSEFPSHESRRRDWLRGFTLLTRATARNPRASEETAGKTTNRTNDTNQGILFTLFIRVIRVIRGCKMHA